MTKRTTLSIVKLICLCNVSLCTKLWFKEKVNERAGYLRYGCEQVTKLKQSSSVLDTFTNRHRHLQQFSLVFPKASVMCESVCVSIRNEVIGPCAVM